MAKSKLINKALYSTRLFVVGKVYLTQYSNSSPYGPRRYIPLPTFFCIEEPSVQSFQISPVTEVDEIVVDGVSGFKVLVGGKVMDTESTDIVHSATKSRALELLFLSWV